MSLGNNLKKARKKRGLTQAEVGKLLGVTEQTISGYERGVRDPDTPQLKRLAEIYQTTTDSLLGHIAPVIITDHNQHMQLPNTRNHVRLLANGNPDKESNLLAPLSDPELLGFWEELNKRTDLQRICKLLKSLSPEGIQRVIRYIQLVEEEDVKDK